jgi:hypothetical protein
VLWLFLIAVALLVPWLLLTAGESRASGTRESASAKSPRRSSTLTPRRARTRRSDETSSASNSGELARMLRGLVIDRHYLFLSIITETYKARHTIPEMRDVCERTAWQHLAEFPKVAEALMAEDKECGGKGQLPRVPTFQHLATVLTENGDYEKALHVCEQAVSFGVPNGKDGGFEERIARIREIQQREHETEEHQFAEPVDAVA